MLSLIKEIRDVYKWRELLWQMVAREVKTRRALMANGSPRSQNPLQTISSWLFLGNIKSYCSNAGYELCLLHHHAYSHQCCQQHPLFYLSVCCPSTVESVFQFSFIGLLISCFLIFTYHQSLFPSLDFSNIHYSGQNC